MRAYVSKLTEIGTYTLVPNKAPTTNPSDIILYLGGGTGTVHLPLYCVYIGPDIEYPPYDWLKAAGTLFFKSKSG